MRYYNGQPVELLAPAGNMAIFRSIVDSRCDAVYFGGQQLNMRMIRKGFNFTNEELKEAIALARSKGKMSYITVNNLVDTSEVEAAKVYLKYLESIQPDAIIVQDFAILNLVQSMGLNLNIHASVMMNVHNLPMIQALERHGIQRVVLSREMPLSEVALIHAKTNVELEYFTHGDMCVAHGAQCYHSAAVFGMSSNRGRCLKPCRWWYNEGEFPLAVKDMCMYGHLREMIHAGITSFKIEGRMRETEFIVGLVNQYGDALDRLIEDPIAYDPLEGYAFIEDNRKRDLSTGYAFGTPGVSNLNTRYEGTGKFFSTGKMFSTPTATAPIDETRIEKLDAQLQVAAGAVRENTLSQTAISVKVQTMAQAQAAIRAGAKRIYWMMETFLPHKPLSLKALAELKAFADTENVELYLNLPRMLNSSQLQLCQQWLTQARTLASGLMVSSLGSLEAFKPLELPMWGDFPLNVYNALASDFYFKEGMSGVTASVEMDAASLSAFIQTKDPIEVIVHGALTTMYLDHDLFEAEKVTPETGLSLVNEAGAFKVYKDNFGRCHIMNTHELCLLPVVKHLANQVSWLRIEGQCMSSETIEKVVSTYVRALSNPFEETGSLTGEFTLGAAAF